MSLDTQTIASYPWQEADPRFAPLPGRNRQGKSHHGRNHDYKKRIRERIHCTRRASHTVPSQAIQQNIRAS
ncbi:predicted protein [Sclerotinia sclerotiorum 1980 UF-70]|uniref:Uncharacterized protein n=1 Tax=Sclerotinia sclerotiorum (strain ATCC 18683 / 1980 / Ss-1) TaxID=665079 RepID=A7EBH4_SCLS1|nr:predicted protein [Sclerotinia sclerotiorum 1980 UF-70]EDN99802.1 predicted protein [Sclerotinia sclerotiorum 1980 UF-70]